MTKNTTTKNTTKNTTAKTTVQKVKVQKASPIRDAYKTLVAELKTLSAAKKAKKSEMLKKIDATWKDYQSYTKNEYKTARAAAIQKFETVKSEAAKVRANKKAEAAAKKIEKAAAKKAVKKPAKKATTKKVETVAETKVEKVTK